MKLEIILLIVISIGFGISLVYFIGYNKISIIKAKMDAANDIISKALKDKKDIMNEIYDKYKKVLKKKDYLKDFAILNTKKISNYNLDIELNNYLKTMTDLKEDNKELNTDEINELFNKIDSINEVLIANKKYYNKNNNLLMKTIKGYIKVIAKINNIKVQTSYETK